MIDIHVHIFPDEIAVQAVDKLAAEAGITHYGDGTARALLAHMDENGVRRSVNQPVATRPGQVSGVNKWITALAAREPRILSFGSLHPDMPGAVDEIRRLHEQGVKGIKLHPDYQRFHPDDDRMLPVYEACRDCGMIVFFHAGRDLAYPYTHGTPARFAQLLGIKGLRVVLAHLGGYRMWDDVEKYLLGKDVYFETSFSHELPPQRLAAMLAAHDPGRLLFGSDHPWGHAGRLAGYLNSLGLEKALLEKIFRGNAEQLLDS